VTAATFAARMNLREYGNEITKAEEAEAKAANLLVVCGYSDDCAEFYGLWRDESYASDGDVIRFDREGLIPDLDDAKLDGVTAYLDAQRRDDAPGVLEIYPLWNDGVWSYTFKGKPCATFNIVEDDALYCIGLVIEMGAE
jgi:hypothetical protein